MEPILLVDSGLKCDAPNCDWKDESISFDDFEKWLDAPCPKCGSNLLTEEDLNNSIYLRDLITVMNSLSEEDLLKMEEAANGLDPSIFEKLGMNEADYNPTDMFSMTIDTHKELKITNITKLPNENTEV